MGISKTNLFTKDQNEIALIAKAFGHPARIAILQQLLKTNTCINSGLVLELGLAQATISQHLKELKTIGLIQGTIEGNSMSYCINPSEWLKVKNTFNSLFDKHSCCKTNNCCN